MCHIDLCRVVNNITVLLLLYQCYYRYFFTYILAIFDTKTFVLRCTSLVFQQQQCCTWKRRSKDYVIYATYYYSAYSLTLRHCKLSWFRAYSITILLLTLVTDDREAEMNVAESNNQWKVLLHKYNWYRQFTLLPKCCCTVRKTTCITIPGSSYMYIQYRISCDVTHPVTLNLKPFQIMAKSC